MSLKSPTQTLFNQDGYAVAAKDGFALSENSAALLLAGSDGTDTHYIALDSNGRSLIAGAGTAGTPEGGILSLQGVTGGQDLPVNVSNFPADQSIVQNNASELLASVGGLGASGSAIVGNPVRLGIKNDADGLTLDLLSDSSGRLIAAGAAVDGDPLAGAPVRIGASDGTNAVDVLSDASGRLVLVGAAADGSAVSGAPILTAGSDGTNTQSLLTDSDGRLIIAGAAADGAAVAGNPVRLGASDGTNTQNILSDDQGRLIRVGAAAAGSAPSGNPVLAGGSDGTDVQIFKLDNAGALQVSQVKCSDATLYTTSATTSSSSLLASNTAREGAIVYNNSNRFLYVKLGSSITSSSFTTKIAPFGQYLVPAGFTGEISGVWIDASASGNAIVTEFAPGAGGGGGGGGTPYSFRYYRMSITKTKWANTGNQSGLDGQGISMDELELLSGGVRVDYTGASVISLTPYFDSSFAVAQKLIDNVRASEEEWWNYPPYWGTGGSTNAYPVRATIDFGTARTADSFRYATSKNNEYKDPIQWTFEGSNDNSTWTTLQTQSTDATVPSARNTFTSAFLFT